VTGDALTLSSGLQTLVYVVTWMIIVSGLLTVVISVVQLVISGFVLLRFPPTTKVGSLWQRYGDFSPPVALLVPAYNEQATLVDNVRSLLSLHYPRFEIIVVNDGSTDGTLDTVVSAFGLRRVTRAYEQAVPHRPVRGLYRSPDIPNLLVVDKENGGKSDALNAAISISRCPLFCAVDADSLLETDALLRAVQPFVADPTRVVAVGGTVRIANGSQVRAGRVVQIGIPRSWLVRFQIVEYFRAFLLARLALSRFNVLTVVSGAFGIFRRRTAVEAGGYSRDVLTEDLEIVVKIHRLMLERQRDYLIRFIPEPVCWTEAPESLRVLSRQRTRWHRGALETFVRHASMLFNPRYGRMGFIGFGQMLIVDVLDPPFEVAGYVLIPLLWAFGVLSIEYLLAFCALSISFGIFISVTSLVLQELELRHLPRARHLVTLAIAAVLENFGYRQVNNLWRVVALWRYLRGTPQRWGDMSRAGFERAA
jgi:cellulose synthase/poly-beta-1,6-N-acetylglucosamine synthase-like glycosyltransferase